MAWNERRALLSSPLNQWRVFPIPLPKTINALTMSAKLNEASLEKKLYHAEPTQQGIQGKLGNSTAERKNENYRNNKPISR